MNKQLKVGIFSLIGLGLIFWLSVFVNDRPFWWRPCQLVHINVPDATGLKTKAPVRSLGIQIGYLKTIALSENYVRLGICITAPVETLPETQAFIRGEGFLGDKFVELKPVRYLGNDVNVRVPHFSRTPGLFALSRFLLSHARAQGQRDIPVGQGQGDMQQLMTSVDSLVKELKGLTTELGQAINPEVLRRTVQQLNITLENAGKTLNPQSGLTATAQRSLSKLEDAIEQLRDMMTRINQGKGSVGLLLNDPQFAEEIRLALRKMNKILGRAEELRFNVNIGAEQMLGWQGTRGWFLLNIWPAKERYYRIGLSSDPRGVFQSYVSTTEVNGVAQNVNHTILTQGGLTFTAQLGRIFWKRFDTSLGLLYGDIALSVRILLGPDAHEERLLIEDDVFARFQGLTGSGGQLNRIDNRIAIQFQPFGGLLFFRAGLDSLYKVNGKQVLTFGGGMTFDDEDIKLLFAFR